MKYPMRSEYDTAIRNMDKFVYDSFLNIGQPLMQAKNKFQLRSYNGGKAIVYEIQAKNKKYALKCWVEDLGDLKNRYKEIDDYLKKIKLPYFVDFSYNEYGILVNGTKFPIVRMEWVDGISFKSFITQNINNHNLIRRFAEQFAEMAQKLHQSQISHGDLQHGNIMINSDGKMCLVDYDSMYVPNLCNEKDNIKGLPGYQHPRRTHLVNLSPKADYFSELVIYLSLLVLAENPNYWQKILNEERLIFSESDLANPKQSQVFSELSKMSQEIRYFSKRVEDYCYDISLENLLPLEDVIKGNNYAPFNWDIPTKKIPDASSISQVMVIESPEWDFTDQSQTTKKYKKNSSSSNGNTDIWDKISGNKNAWDKLDKKHVNKIPPKPEKGINENNYIWNRLAKSVSSIWDKITKWFA